MSDKPTVGSFGEPPENETDGLVLYDTDGSLEPVDDEIPAFTQTKRSYTWMVVLGVVVGAVGAYVFFDALKGRRSVVDAEAQLPEMVPSLIDGQQATEVLRPVSQRPLVGEVGSTVDVRMRANGIGGVPMADTLVRFRVEGGDGAVIEEEVRTDASGVAATEVLLPRTPGTTVVVAEVPGIPEMRVPVEARPGAPERIAAVAGIGQSTEVGELLPTRVAVVVTDSFDNPVPGALVSFSVRSGDGIAAPSRKVTDSMGQASALWRLGMQEGEQVLAATSPGLATEALFRATARPRPEPVQTVDPSTGIETAPVTVRPAGFIIGASHVCRLQNGLVRCRGADARGAGSSDVSRPFAALASGLSHTCGLDGEGAAYCWGANEAGQLGDGSITDRPSPVPVRSELRFSLLTAGAAHTCGLAGGGVPVCWGHNLSGQLGDGSRTDQRGPRTVGGGISFRGLTAGWDHTCGLTSSGNAFCWGANSQGQLGDGSTLDRLVPTLVRGAVESLVAGSAHTCGSSERRVLCWGANDFGQLGDGTTEDRSQPTAVTGLPSAPTMLAAGAVHTCALVAGGAAYCWGQNLQGQLGDGTTQSRTTPVVVSGDIAFSRIYAGGALTCGVSVDGAEYCWGLNQNGQLGDGTRVNRLTPTRVGG